MASKTIVEKYLTGKCRKTTYSDLFDMYFERCLSRLVRLFKWEGLPFPQHEMESRAYLDGYAGVVKDDKRGVMTAWGGMSGATEYEDYFKKFTYAAPTASGGTKTIGKECVILRSNSLGTPMGAWIKRYADLYAHNDISLRLALVNTRYQDIIKVTDSAKKETVKEWYKGLYNGDLMAMVDDMPLSEFIEGQGAIQTLDLTSKKEIDFTNFTELENELTRTFYRDIGVRWNKDKKANLVSGEVEQDNMLLEFNVNDMLESRKKFCEEYNAVMTKYGVPQISVSLAIPLETDESSFASETESEESDDANNC